MVIKEDQEKVRALLKEAITVLCQNGLKYNSSLLVQGLVGVTVDEGDVFLIDFKETFRKQVDSPCSDNSEDGNERSTNSRRLHKSNRKRRPSRDTDSDIHVPSKRNSHPSQSSSAPQAEVLVKQEIIDSDDDVIIKDEVDDADYFRVGPEQERQGQVIRGEEGAMSQSSIWDTGGAYSMPAGNQGEEFMQSSEVLASEWWSSQDNRSNDVNLGDISVNRAQITRFTNSGRVFVCPRCGKEFGYSKTLYRHIRTHHSKTSPHFKCGQCGKSYPRKDYLYTHVRNHCLGAPIVTVEPQAEDQVNLEPDDFHKGTSNGSKNLHFHNHSIGPELQAEDQVNLESDDLEALHDVTGDINVDSELDNKFKGCVPQNSTNSQETLYVKMRERSDIHVLQISPDDS